MTIQRFESSARSSQMVRHGDTLYLSGQVAPGDTVSEQATAVLASIDRLLKQAGSGREHLLSATVWLADINDFSAMNAVWDDWVRDVAPPARSTGEVRLAAPEYLIEVIVVAAVPDRQAA